MAQIDGTESNENIGMSRRVLHSTGVWLDTHMVGVILNPKRYDTHGFGRFVEHVYLVSDCRRVTCKFVDR